MLRSGTLSGIAILAATVSCVAVCALVLLNDDLLAQDTADQKPAQTPREVDILRDDFEDGKLTLDWEVVRENESSVSLKDHPGELTILTERGSIYEDQDNHPNAVGGRAKNLHLIDNPLDAEADWHITTRLVEFQPNARDHQAGILIYVDDENYVKCVVQYSRRGGRILRLAAEKDKVYTRSGGQIDLQYDDVWVRLQRKGTKYTAYVSYDGEKFSELGEVEWNREPKQVGLFAKNGGKIDAPTIEARFDFFEFTELKDNSKPEQ